MLPLSEWLELAYKAAIVALIGAAAIWALRAERRRAEEWQARRTRVAAEYPRYEIGSWTRPGALEGVCLASVGGCLASGVVASTLWWTLGSVLGVVSLVGFVASVVALDRASSPRQRAWHEVILADVRARAGTMDGAELAQLVDDLEKTHGRQMRPLRELLQRA